MLPVFVSFALSCTVALRFSFLTADIFFLSLCVAVEREVVQKRTFTRWMNLHLEKVCDCRSTRWGRNTNYALCTLTDDRAARRLFIYYLGGTRQFLFHLLPLHPETQARSIYTTDCITMLRFLHRLTVCVSAAAETRAVRKPLRSLLPAL